MWGIRTLLTIAALVLLGGLSLPGRAAAQPYSSLMQHDYNRRPPVVQISQILPDLMEKGDIPGVSIAVILDGDIAYCRGFGTADVDTGREVDLDTVFSAASLSKPLFAYCVMRLVDRGVLDLDQPLCELLPDPAYAEDPRYEQVTARMVLSHTSGFPRWNPGRFHMLDDPGHAFHYSGEGYAYLQRVVEHITGKTLNEIATREAFEPLGMTRSCYYWRKDFTGNAVAGHGLMGSLFTLPKFTEDRQSAAFSLLTTSWDYARFVIAVANGTGLTKQTQAEMLRAHTQVLNDELGRPFEHINWALGWGLEDCHSGEAFWQWGNNGKYRAYAMCYPDSGTGLVYFANSDTGMSILDEVINSVVEDEHQALEMLDFEKYDQQGWAEKRQRQKDYLKGDIAAGDDLYYEHSADDDARDPLDLPFFEWLYNLLG